MPDPSSSSPSGRVAALAESFLQRYRNGEWPALAEYTDRYPELADEIRLVFPAMVEMERLGPLPGAAEPTGPFADGEPAHGPAIHQIGDYLVLREIGRGGMGVVYEAEQASLGRHVALKVLPGHARLDAKLRERFRREARAAARLHHTHIVPVFGVGEHEGTPYYVMQYIRGQALDEVLGELRRLRRPEVEPEPGAEAVGPRPSQALGGAGGAASAAAVAQALLTGRFTAAAAAPSDPGRSGGGDGAPAAAPATTLDGPAPEPAGEPPAPSPPADLAPTPASWPGKADSSTLSGSARDYWRGVARIGVQAAEALDYAHAQGTLHRDIKPSNLLLDLQGTVWITDFGLAKAADEANLTRTGDILGTLRYMAPERFRGVSDPRSDVYGLGLTLYELLTFEPAFAEADRERLIHQVTQSEPPRPSKLNPEVPRDLETIVLKAIDREPSRRYLTAGELAEDLQLYLEDRPIRARRASVAERAMRWCRRNPLVAGLAAAVAALLIAVAASATVAAVQFSLVASKEERLHNEAQSRAEAETKAKEELQASLYYQRISLADLELSQDNLRRAREQLLACPEGLRQWEWSYLERLCRLDPVILRDEAEVNSVAFSPDGGRLASAGGGGTIKVRDSKTGKVVRALNAKTDFVYSVAFHPHGNHVASAGADRLVKVWDLTTAEVVFTGPGSQGDPYQNAYVVAFSPDGRCLAAGSEGVLNVWDWRNRQLLHTLPGHADYRAFAVAFSPDGRRLASEGLGCVEIWDAETGEHLRTLRGHRARWTAIVFSPDGRRLATSSFDQTIKLWDLATGQDLFTLRGQDGRVNGVAFSPDGLRLASVGDGKTVRVWEASTGREVLGLRGHTNMNLGVAFSPDGRRLASAGRDATIRLWDATPLQSNERQEVHTFSQEGGEVSATEGVSVQAVAISPKGQRVASGGEFTHVKVWDLRSGQGCVEFTGTRTHSIVFSVAWHPDGRRFCSSGITEGNVFNAIVWDAQSGREAFPLPVPLPQRATFAVAFSPDGRHLVTGGANQTVQVWDAQTGHEVGTLGAHDRDIQGLSFSPDGRHLASASGDGAVKIWDATRLGEKQEARRTLRARAPGFGFNLAFSPDGRRLVAGGEKNTVKIWDVQTGEELHSLIGHRGDVWAAAFSPDPGRWVASAGEDSTVKVWDSQTEALVRSFRGHTGVVTSVAFSPDGQLLVSGSRDGTVKVWDVTSLGKKPEE